MELGDYQGALLSKALHFIQNVGLFGGWTEGHTTVLFSGM
jgi:hypothetical protein